MRRTREKEKEKKLHGRMYVGSIYLCFYCRIFGYRYKVTFTFFLLHSSLSIHLLYPPFFILLPSSSFFILLLLIIHLLHSSSFIFVFFIHPSSSFILLYPS